MKHDFEFHQYNSEELYKIRDTCDEIENHSLEAINKGLCLFTCEVGKTIISTYMLIDSIFKPTEHEQYLFPRQGIAFYLSSHIETPEENAATRIIAAGFLACLIDDELIARGD